MHAARGRPPERTHPPDAPSVVHWLLPLLIAVAAIATFARACGNGFVNWDDPANLLTNPHFRGLSADHLQWMFTSNRAGNYEPLHWLSMALVYTVWGLNPAGYHALAVLLHAANAVLFFWIVRRLLGGGVERDSWSVHVGGAFAALVFALHPLRTEAVAWASGQHYTLTGFFCLSAVLAYLRSVRPPRQRPTDATPPTVAAGNGRSWRALSVLCFACSLLAMPVTILFPLALLVMDAYPLRRTSLPRRSLLWEKAPYLALTVAALAVMVATRTQSTIHLTLEQHGMAARLMQAAYGMAFFARTLVWPIGLSPFYERPVPMIASEARFVVSAVLVVGLTVGLILARRRFPAGLAAWGVLAILVAPVVGLVPSGPHLVTDRYSYLGTLGLALLAGAALQWLWRRPRWRPGGGVAAAAVVLALAALSFRQVGYWHDSQRLWNRVLEVQPGSSVAYHLRGLDAGQQGRPADAERDLRQAVRLNPNLLRAAYDLGNLLNAQGRIVEAVQWYRRVTDATDEGSAAAQAHNNLGNILARSGQFAEAVDHYRKSLTIDPRSAQTHSNMGNALLRLNRVTDAARAYEKAARLQPDFALAYARASQARRKLGQDTDALALLRDGVRHAPNDTGLTLSLAWLRASSTDPAVRNGSEALRLAESLERSVGADDVEVLDVKAAALAERGRFDEAVQHAARAVQIAQANGDRAHAADIERRRALYLAGQPYRTRRTGATGPAGVNRGSSPQP